MVAVEGARNCRAASDINERQLLVDAEGTAGDRTDSVAGREVSEELAAVIVHAGSGADDHFVVEEARLPCRADAGSDAPLASGERGVTHAFGAVGVVSGDDQPGILDGVGAGAVVIEGRLEVEDAAVLLGEAAVPVVAHAGGQRNGRHDLPLVLHIGAQLVGAVVAAGIALQERGDVETGSRAARGDKALHKLAEVVGGNRAHAGALVDGIELGISVTGAKADCVLAQRPDGVPRGGQPVLEDAGIGRLRFRVGTDIQHGLKRNSDRLILPQHIVDGDAGEVIRSEDVDRSRSGRAAGNRVGPEGLLIVAPVLLAQHAQRLGGAEVRLDDQGVAERQDLRAGVQVLAEAGNARIRVGRDGRIVLVEVLRAQSVLGGGVVVEIGHGQIRGEPARAGDEGIVEMGGSRGTGVEAVVGD